MSNGWIMASLLAPARGYHASMTNPAMHANSTPRGAELTTPNLVSSIQSHVVQLDAPELGHSIFTASGREHSVFIRLEELYHVWQLVNNKGWKWDP